MKFEVIANEKNEFRQGNMYCNACFMNVLNALSEVCGIQELDIGMQKVIRVQGLWRRDTMRKEGMGVCRKYVFWQIY
jgi:hypothetical protein